MAVPKPKHCDQDWLEMNPTEGGRICGACEKTIVDFSRMKWKEIELIQTENNNSVCGMYTDRQLNNWGEEPKRSFFKLPTATASSLILMLAQLTPSDSIAQTTPEIEIVADTTVRDAPIVEVEDTVTVVLRGLITIKSNNGVDDPFYEARVIIRSGEDLEFVAGAKTNEEGLYSISLRYPISTIRGFKVEVSSMGQKINDDLTDISGGIIRRDYQLIMDLDGVVFSVPLRSKWQEKRYNRKLKREDRKMKNNLN